MRNDSNMSSIGEQEKMIKKCDKAGCTRAGTCRAPKSRDLREYWYFCPEHAAEYNKNWNYYANMTPDEIEDDWECQTFGTPLRDKNTANSDAADYAKFINDFITGRATFDHTPTPGNKLPGPVMGALSTFELPVTASWRDVSARYRVLAKKYHPDTATDKQTAASEFARISSAYDTLKKHFGKK